MFTLTYVHTRVIWRLVSYAYALAYEMYDGAMYIADAHSYLIE